MKIGVAIPAYNGHIDSLFKLLDSIQNQTHVPDKVAVSCSSTKNTDFDLYFEKIKNYTFPLQIITSEEKKCAAQNRNIAGSNLTDVDYITFIDADDIMHPQRIEILLNIFQEYDCDIILHNYSNLEKLDDVFLLKKIESNEINVRINSLEQCFSGCIKHKIYYNDTEKIHHGHVSLKQYIFNTVTFPEEPEFYRKEDCIFCYRVFSLPNIKNVYISNELTYYNPSNTQIMYF
jgi:glycosyltransferase involved in cell wall biosynthesis